MAIFKSHDFSYKPCFHFEQVACSMFDQRKGISDDDSPRHVQLSPSKTSVLRANIFTAAIFLLRAPTDKMVTSCLVPANHKRPLVCRRSAVSDFYKPVYLWCSSRPRREVVQFHPHCYHHRLTPPASPLCPLALFFHRPCGYLDNFLPLCGEE